MGHDDKHAATHEAGEADALGAKAIALTTHGDMVYRAAADNMLARLPAGVAGQVLLTGGPAADPYWGAGPPPGAHEDTHVLGGADAIDSGLNALAIALTTHGDMVYRAAAANTLARLAPGVAGQALLSGGPGADPYWGAAPPPGAHEDTHVLGGTDAIDSGLDARAIALANQGDIPYRAAAANTLAPLAPGVAGQALLTGGPGADPYWGTPPAAADTRGYTIVVAASNSLDPTLAPAAYRCDGVADEVQINAAIAALPAAGGSVVLLEGTYTIAATIAINRNNVMLVGSGHGTLIQVSANVDMIRVGDGTAARTNVIIKDLQVDGSAATGVANNGIFFRGAAGKLITRSRVEGCYVHDNYSYGIYLMYSEDCMVVRNRVESARLDGIYLYHGNRNQVALNDCDDCTESAIGVTISDWCIITNNKCSSSADGIEVDNCKYDQVVGNYCEGNTVNGIEIRNNSDDNMVVGNYCQGNGTGIDVSAATSVRNYVMDNCLRGNPTTFSDTGTDTKLAEVMTPVFDDSDANASLSNIGDHVSIAMADTFDVTVRFNFRVPSGFQQLVRARVVVVPLGTGDLRRGVTTDWGACGEVYNTGSGSIAAGEVAVTLNEMECLDVDAALAGIAAGDHVGVAFTRYGSDDLDTVEADVHAIMFWMQYV